MRKIFATLLIVLLPIFISDIAFARGSGSHGGSHSVRGYVTQKGTYVAPHSKTNPNNTKLDNWSTKGNMNPMTGKPGTKNP